MTSAKSGMKQLFDKKLVIVVGKGGVGRTTIAAAFARAAANAGKRVLLAQTHSPARLARLLGTSSEIGPDVMAIDARLSAVNMDPKVALHEYGVLLLRYEPIYRAVFENKPMRSFLGAFPGLDYWTMLGKAWWHTREKQSDGLPKYDLVVLDGPASGHAVAMLRIPDAVRSAMPRGPLSRDAGLARETLSDERQTAALLVTLAEELPARETATLARDLRELRIPLGALVANALPPAEAADADVERIVSANDAGAVPPALADLFAGSSVLGARRRDADKILADLATLGVPMHTMPRLPSNNLGPKDLQTLAARMADL